MKKRFAIAIALLSLLVGIGLTSTHASHLALGSIHTNSSPTQIWED